jgi:hypothetical protein
VQLAKLEMSESVRQAGKGAVRLGIAFGIGIVALVAFTLLLATLIGRLVAGHMWVGAIVTGIIELALAMYLIQRGKAAFKEPSYTFHETREGLKALR